MKKTLKTFYEDPWKFIIFFVILANIAVVFDQNLLLAIILFIIFIIAAEKLSGLLINSYDLFKEKKINLFFLNLKNIIEILFSKKTFTKKKHNVNLIFFLYNWYYKFFVLTWIEIPSKNLSLIYFDSLLENDQISNYSFINSTLDTLTFLKKYIS